MFKKQNTKLITLSFLEMCKKVAEQTDCNDHIRAKITVAKYFKLQRFLIFFNFIEQIHNFDGSLLNDISILRSDKGKEMMALLKTKLTEKEYNLLEKSF